MICRRWSLSFCHLVAHISMFSVLGLGQLLNHVCDVIVFFKNEL